jgi:HK97 family phage portal protein
MIQIMAIWNSIKRFFIADLGVTDEKAWNPALWNIRGLTSESGETVTPETALTYSAIWNAAVLYAGTISTLPLHLLRQDGQKTLRVTEKKLYRVLKDRFNPYMTAQIGREVMINHALLWGNAYAEIVRNQVGEIVELWPITPNRVQPKLENSELKYEIAVDGEKKTLERDKILHIPGLGFDGFTGYSVVSMARKSIGLGMALETFGALYFGQGTHPGVVITHPGQLSPAAHSNLKTELTTAHSGLGLSHRLMLLDEGMKLEKMAIPPEDSQFLESRQFHISEIARWFNLPPHKLKDLSRSSFSNIESEQISFVTDSILPWLVRLEQQFNMQLLTEKERYQEELFTRHNVDGLLRGDATARSGYYRTMFGIGAMSINDIREKEGWDPVEHGDERFIPLNMIPLSKVDEYMDKQSAKAPEKKEVEEKPEEKPAAVEEPTGKEEHRPATVPVTQILMGETINETEKPQPVQTAGETRTQD